MLGASLWQLLNVRRSAKKHGLDVPSKESFSYSKAASDAIFVVLSLKITNMQVWERHNRAILEFVQLRSREWCSVVSSYYFMPIPTAPMCLSCHYTQNKTGGRHVSLLIGRPSFIFYSPPYYILVSIADSHEHSYSIK